MTKLSIITINRNNAQGLRRTIESVVSQTSTDYEYIIIDGASTDESVEVIREFENLKIWEFKDAKTKEISKRLQWLSEPDKGIYNAMNKGIARAGGEYCLFLNSGDWLVDTTVLDDFCKANFKEDVVSGNMMLVYEDGRQLLWESESVEEFGFETIYTRSLPHQASFIKKKLFESYGGYNEKNKIVSDREFFFKTLIIENASYIHLQRTVAYYDMYGISAQIDWNQMLKDELEAMFLRYIPLRIYQSYKKCWSENVETRPIIREYLNLKNGKTAPIINILLRIKSLIN